MAVFAEMMSCCYAVAYGTKMYIWPMLEATQANCPILRCYYIVLWYVIYDTPCTNTFWDVYCSHNMIHIINSKSYLQDSICKPIEVLSIHCVRNLIL